MKNKISSWYNSTHKSLNRNLQKLGAVFAKWAKEQIELGAREDWDAARDNYSFAKKLKKVNLWIDSVDFGLLGKRSVRRSSDAWSYKLNLPGRRF